MIYLDYYAAAPLLPQARETMRRAEQEGWANPESVHRMGQIARRYVEDARSSIAKNLFAHPSDIVLASSGTEACNLAIEGTIALGSIRRIITTALEHPAVSECVARQKEKGIEVHTIAPVHGKFPAAEEIACLFDSQTLLAMQCVNHETGSIPPFASYAQLAKERGGKVFFDAVAAFGSQTLNAEKMNCDMLALSSPKIGGPTGAGALWVARSHSLKALVVGGMHERGRRAGTLSAALVAGFGAACDALETTRSLNTTVMPELRARLEADLCKLGGVVNGAEGERTGVVSNLSFEGWRSDWLVAALDLEGVCVSAGAACSSGQEQSSPVIAALYPAESWRARSALRLSLGPGLDSPAIDKTLQAFGAVLARSPAKI